MALAYSDRSVDRDTPKVGMKKKLPVAIALITIVGIQFFLFWSKKRTELNKLPSPLIGVWVETDLHSKEMGVTH